MISQTLLAVPMWLLFELGIIFSRIFYSKKPETETDETPDFDEDGNDILPKGFKNEPPDSGPGSGGAAVDEGKASDDDSLQFADDEMNEWQPMSQEEMDAELDRLDAEEAAASRAEDENDEDPRPEGEPAQTDTDPSQTDRDHKDK